MHITEWLIVIGGASCLSVLITLISVRTLHKRVKDEAHESRNWIQGLENRIRDAEYVSERIERTTNDTKILARDIRDLLASARRAEIEEERARQASPDSRIEL